MGQTVSWIHFGDLHVAGRDEQNYRDFLTLIDEANRYMAADIDFALLPGDNADDGEEDEYLLVAEALAGCRFPVNAIPGDHDAARGTLDLFRKYLADPPHRSFALGESRFVFLNSVAGWHPPVFGLGAEQMRWLRGELASAREAGERAVAFMHAYPSEHGADAAELSRMFRENGVCLVEMGHTHYNELANDGRIVYAATRSTGQIEEGPVGFSVTTLDAGAVSWKFKPLGEWPLAMITWPADERLIVDPSQVVRGPLTVRARVWGESIARVDVSVDGRAPVAMEPAGASTWGGELREEHPADGSHELTVTARDAGGRIAHDRIRFLANREGRYTPPARREPDYENALGAWPEKHIFGTQLGPDENGHAWPPRRARRGAAR